MLPKRKLRRCSFSPCRFLWRNLQGYSTQDSCSDTPVIIFISGVPRSSNIRFRYCARSISFIGSPLSKLKKFSSFEIDTIIAGCFREVKRQIFEVPFIEVALIAFIIRCKVTTQSRADHPASAGARTDGSRSQHLLSSCEAAAFSLPSRISSSVLGV